MSFWSLALIVFLSVPGPVEAPPATGVVTPLDYFDSGRQRVDAYLGDSGPLRDAADAAILRCARVEIRDDHDANTFTSVFGSGVLLGDGRHFLTAGHVLDGFDGGEILVTFPGGESSNARLVDHRYEMFGEDWAILTLDTPPASDELRTAAAAVGSLALVFGYPGHIGIDARGEVVFGESSTRVLRPIVTLGTVGNVEPLTLDPRVGAVPTEGISGGPAFDARGRLLGIMVSVQREQSAASSYHYRIVPVGEIPGIGEMMSRPVATRQKKRGP